MGQTHAATPLYYTPPFGRRPNSGTHLMLPKEPNWHCARSAASKRARLVRRGERRVSCSARMQGSLWSHRDPSIYRDPTISKWPQVLQYYIGRPQQTRDGGLVCHFLISHIPVPSICSNCARSRLQCKESRVPVKNCEISTWPNQAG